MLFTELSIVKFHKPTNSEMIAGPKNPYFMGITNLLGNQKKMGPAHEKNLSVKRFSDELIYQYLQGLACLAYTFFHSEPEECK